MKKISIILFFTLLLSFAACAFPTQKTALAPMSTEKPETTGTPKISTFSITYFDVGQGDAALIECDGHYMMIDGGDEKYSGKMYSYLQSNEINYLDIVVASHAHKDHVGGLAGVKKMKESNKVYFENVTREDVIKKGYKSCGNCHP